MKHSAVVVWGGWSGRAPYGARGLKLILLIRTIPAPAGRAPYGARGLKPAKVSGRTPP